MNTDSIGKKEFDIRRIPLNLFNNELHGDTYFTDWNECIHGDVTDLKFTRIKGAFSTEFMTTWNDIINCYKDRAAYMFKYFKYGFNYNNIYDYKDNQFQFISQQVEITPRVIRLEDLSDDDFVMDYIINFIGKSESIENNISYIKNTLDRYKSIYDQKSWMISHNIPLFIKLLFNLKVFDKVYLFFIDEFTDYKYAIDYFFKQEYNEIIDVLNNINMFNKDKLENYLAIDSFDKFRESIVNLRNNLTGSGRNKLSLMLLEKE